MKWAPRIRLRTIFLLFFCAAVGLTCAMSPPAEVDPTTVGFMYVPRLNWSYGLLTAASVAMVIGLIQQIRQLARLNLRAQAFDGEFSFARWYGITWRVVIAVAIVTCLLVQLLISRQFIELPEHQDFFSYDVFPNQLWMLCVIIVLSNSVARWRQGTTHREKSRWRRVVEWLAGTFLALILLPDVAFILFLVHVATAGIEGALPLREQRIGTFPDHASECFRVFWIGLGAVGIILSAAAVLMSISRADTENRGTLKISSFLALLLAAAAFCAWYYGMELRRISPDLASAGSPGNWLDWIGAILMAVFVVSAGAYRMARSAQTFTVFEHQANERDQISFHEAVACQLLLFAAVGVYTVETIRSWIYPTPFGSLPIGELIHYLFRDQNALLYMAIGLLTLQSSWVCWRQFDKTFVWQMAPLNGWRYLWCWLALAALVVVGIPTISAYCFAFWLGPWYRYGQ